VSCRAALIALRIAQPIGFRVQQGVQRLLHATPHHPVEVILDPLVSIVMTLFSGLGIVSFMAAYLFVRKNVYVIHSIAFLSARQPKWATTSAQIDLQQM
jgi:hypothetical protein